MSRSFLSSSELQEMAALLAPPSFVIDGFFHPKEDWHSGAFSAELIHRCLEKFRKDPDFESAGPIWLGSAARGELCPRSDLDVLFVGNEDAIGRFVRRQQEQGIRLRSRSPEDLTDWTVGVDVPDILALSEAVPLVPGVVDLLQEQKKLIAARAKKERKKWLALLTKERREREKRFNSIANSLEPNLKYGPGGLRDLDQARQLLRLFPERFEGADHARLLLDFHAGFWILLRQKLHLDGQGDLLSSTAQFDLAKWLGLGHRDFMREVQKGLSRVHFYANWIFERASVPNARWEKLEKRELKTPAAALALLEKDCSVLAQQHVRRHLDLLFTDTWIRKNVKERGRLLGRVVRPGISEKVIEAVFSSRMIDKLCPDFRPLVGWVQHDQYHRYTADVHLQQACREWQMALKSPRRLGPLAIEVRDLSTTDQKILGWAFFCHDLMKGREGDHSDLGKVWVRKELPRFGVPAALVKEIEWLVEHHLELSQAAFRRNPMSPTTWLRLKEIDAEGPRLRRLAVFTACDILATNPEAWTPWKSRLLADLLKALRSTKAQGYFKFRSELEKAGVSLDPELIDGFLLSRLPQRILAQDLADAKKSGSKALEPKVFSSRTSGFWIRFHAKEDRPGTFADFVERLYSLGLGVRHAAVHTLDGIGVYDWFEVSTRKTPAQIRTWLLAAEPKSAPAGIHFDSVSLVSEDDQEWVLSFKGLDQSGCLAAAARALANEQVSLRSARVHTWGRQVDDLFHVVPKGLAADLLARLREFFNAQESTRAHLALRS